MTRKPDLLERFDRQTRGILDGRLKLSRVALRPEFEKIRPWRSLGLLSLHAEMFRSERLESISLATLSLIGLFRIYNMVFRPSPVYNLPILTSDIMLTGDRRAFYIEVIDPTHLDDENKAAGYQRMMDLKRQTAAFEQRQAFSEWYRQVLADCSIMTRTTSENDDIMLRVHGAFLNVYLDMVAGAVPLPDDKSARVRDSMVGFVERLVREGGSSVKMIKRLLGEQKGREYVTGVVFGISGKR
ncbi:MAG: hypothetical protein N3E40_04875 [Dehalococcoidia bacterium]|nr:hypothetical protein [Dehalococcoidia bacterium]